MYGSSLLHLARTREQVAKGVTNANDIHRENLSALDRLAMRITALINVKFFLWTAGISIVWIVWNLVALTDWRFDPAPNYQFWLFLSNFLQLLLMPLILVGQNLQGRHAEARAESDYHVNMEALRLLNEIHRSVTGGQAASE